MYHDHPNQDLEARKLSVHRRSSMGWFQSQSVPAAPEINPSYQPWPRLTEEDMAAVVHEEAICVPHMQAAMAPHQVLQQHVQL
jgi:hypothetical protein